ncbi:MAG: coproporphyrinogen III oxidase family protein, partial [Bacilli bacterium]|nr:coproporphyrinogen III oxidase family protein [Bacilli bacterium]
MKSMYIHIPFCKSICSYCDFCKFFYNQELVNKYIDRLILEIKDNYRNDILDTIYIGGGTPSSLDIDNLEKLLSFIKDNIKVSKE